MSPTAARHPEEPQGSLPQPAADAPQRPESAYSGAGEQGAGVDARDAGPGAAVMDNQGFKKGDICGDWKIERFVAAGGMGEVYEVRGTLGRKRGALKQIRPQLSTKPELEKRFETEVEILAALECPYIVPLLHAGKHNGRPYLVMEWLEGMTLRDFLNQQREPIPLAEALHYATCIAIALCAAHAADVFHRDLKPENVFMLEKGTLKVLDFGLGKWAGSNRVSTSEQAGGMCTVHYAAPEQLERTGVDDRTDVRALALIIVEMLTLTYAFADRPGVLPAREVARAMQLVSEPNSLRALLPGCPESLAALIDAALSRDKTKRPHSTEFLAALRAERRALRDAEQTGAARSEDADSADEAAPAPTPAEPAHETSAVRVIRQLRTATLPPDQPPGDPTAVGNPAPQPVKTIKMVRPPEADFEAARRAKAAKDAGVQHAATQGQAGDTTGGGRSATLPPEPSSSTAVPMPEPAAVTANAAPVPLASALPAAQPAAGATMPRSQDPTMQGPDASAAARASLELATRETLPWKRALPAQDGTPSLTPMHRGLPQVDGPQRPRLPMWTAPVFGMAATFVVFLVIKLVQAHGGDAHKEGSTPAAPTATAAATGSAAPTTTAEASPTAAPTATASAATAAPNTSPPAPPVTAAPKAAPSATGAAPGGTPPARGPRGTPHKPPAKPAEAAPSATQAKTAPTVAPHRMFGSEP
jgi:hypothetical protein